MYRLFHNYDNGENYVMRERCTVRKILQDTGTHNGLLIICTENLFEVVEYADDTERLFISCTVSKDGVRKNRMSTVNKDTEHVLEVLQSLIREWEKA